MGDPQLLIYLVVALAALVTSGLTLYTGFGLGTLLLPAFVLFFPPDVAVILTAVVHLLNNLFKLGLVGPRADRGVVVRFGLPAIAASWAGAWSLLRLSGLEPLFTYEVLGRVATVDPLRLVFAALMILFAAAELSPALQRLSVPSRWLPLGGLLSGYFGGLSGHQGAFRSIFLLRSGLDKTAYIATGVVLAVLVDLSRMTVYAGRVAELDLRRDGPVLLVATLAAFLGAWIANRMLPKITLKGLRYGVGVLLILIALGLAIGLI
jgi:uncharacterized protein